MLRPYPTNLINAYPISTKIANKSLNDMSLAQSFGKPVYFENISYQKMSRPGKKETGENKVHAALAKKMKTGK